MDPTEMAHFYLFLSEQQLKEIDLALKTGEKFLERYPTSSYFSSVQMQMQSLLNHRQDQAKGAAEMDAKMSQLEVEHASQRAQLKTPEAEELGERSYAFRRCSELRRLQQERRAIDACNAFVDHWGANTREGTRQLVLDARWLVALSWAELGDFTQARAAAKKLIDEEPEFARQRSLETMAGTWPRD
jgi:tetratricopeptide (TPR) repeat protein